MTPAWYIVAIVGGRERTALGHVTEILEPRGLRAFLPAERHFTRINRRRVKIERALLPGYMFAELTDAEFPLIRGPDRNGYGLEGVRGLLGHETSVGRAPVMAPPDFVEALAFCQAMGAFDRTLPSHGRFAPAQGDAVVVTGGQFQGLVGKIAKAAPGAKRVKVVLEACGVFGSGPMELDIGLLAAAA